jgi:hypothetical protein
MEVGISQNKTFANRIFLKLRSSKFQNTIGKMRNLLYLFLGIYLMACESKPAEPEWLLSDEKMQNILIDFYYEEAKIIDQRFSHNESTEKFLAAQEATFKKYQVDSVMYRKTYEYYLENNQDKLSKIYKVVVDTLQKRKDLISPVLR